MVHCESCNTENKSKAKFCIKCGHRLVVEVDDPCYTFAVGRIITIIIFGSIGLYSLVHFSLIGLLISVLGIFISLPYFNNFTQKRFNYRLPKWSKIVILICLLFPLFLLPNTTSKKIESSSDLPKVEDKLDLEGMNLDGLSAEEVLDRYLLYLNYDSFPDRINKIKFRKQLTNGIVLKLLDIDEAKFTEGWSIVINSLDNCKKLVDAPTCNQFYNSFKTSNNVIEILSKEIIETSSDMVKIKIKHKNIQTEQNNTNELIEEKIYILRREANIWKIVDYIDEEGDLISSAADLRAYESRYDSQIKKLPLFFENIKYDILATKQLTDFKMNLFNGINKAIPVDRIISVDITDLDKNSHKYTVSIIYYFKDVWLADNYLQVLKDSSALFAAVFPVDSKIYEVNTLVKEKVTDDYGNTKERQLAKVSMNRDTYNKINWAGFKYESLDKIASVSFSGDSILKDLKDLEQTSKNLQSMPWGNGFPMIVGAPSNMCDSAKEQCDTFNTPEECELYDMLKSQRMC